MQSIVVVARGYLGHRGSGAVTAWSGYVGGNLRAFSIRAAQLSLQLGVLGRFCGLELMSARLVIFGDILVFNGGVCRLVRGCSPCFGRVHQTLW